MSCLFSGEGSKENKGTRSNRHRGNGENVVPGLGRNELQTEMQLVTKPRRGKFVYDLGKDRI